MHKLQFTTVLAQTARAFKFNIQQVLAAQPATLARHLHLFANPFVAGVVLANDPELLADLDKCVHRPVNVLVSV